MGNADKSQVSNILPSMSRGYLLKLQNRFILLLALSSLIPLIVIALGAGVIYRNIIFDKSVNHLQSSIQTHANTIELFLAERLKVLTLMASAYRLEDMQNAGELKQFLSLLNDTYENSFTDLGVIDSVGNHLAYEGPYDLLKRNYSKEAWFERTVKEGTFISDMFLGFRNEPHFILAVRNGEGPEFWILRASINSEVFERLVRAGRTSVGSDCFLVDHKGKYQTHPKTNEALLVKSGITFQQYFSDIRTETIVTAQNRKILRTTKWIINNKWLLVVQQDESEFMAEVDKAVSKGFVVLAFGILIIIATAVFSTRYLVKLVRLSLDERDKANQQFMQASKMAAIGELSTGLAHEINNPLAVILSEQTNIGDLLGEIDIDEAHDRELSDSVALVKKQVLRCRSITQKMLKFGRHGTAQSECIHPDIHLAEIVGLLKKQATVNNVDLQLDIEKVLPEIQIDSSEFEQIVTNLITNALQAVGSDGVVLTSAVMEGDTIHFTIEDTGPGISPEYLDRIFTPFFTTKPVGLGTGLGLSVCYGIVTQWNGKIWAESDFGKGAIFHLTFPIATKAESRIKN